MIIFLFGDEVDFFVCSDRQRKSKKEEDYSLNVILVDLRALIDHSVQTFLNPPTPVAVIVCNPTYPSILLCVSFYTTWCVCVFEYVKELPSGNSGRGQNCQTRPGGSSWLELGTKSAYTQQGDPSTSRPRGLRLIKTSHLICFVCAFSHRLTCDMRKRGSASLWTCHNRKATAFHKMVAASVSEKPIPPSQYSELSREQCCMLRAACYVHQGQRVRH
ncbi:hypothetical protein RRG08_041809 [Elysia crispata]|uniref:Uncharacterized protein n=1 Tax=Elysia crispata TaxID=231223 RepID=A0AAE1D5C2_9GAST|nr:hypothetical protein RRG08_041809 [Elysia crispata]